ncbi:MAG: outer membrane beta-barrel protein [Bacteroidales bacterium]|nr:outer membrane beta-barrel protein [Bacteroidales bacterium]
MNRKNFVVAIVTVLAVMQTSIAMAQDKLELGLFGGVSYYMGDLNPSQQFLKPRPAIGFIGRYTISDRTAVKLNVIGGGIAGKYPKQGDVYKNSEGITTTRVDANGNTIITRDSTYNFDRTIVDIGLMGEFNFMSFDHQFLKEQSRFTPYITIGIAATSYKRYDKGDDDGHMVFVLSLPFGAGVKYKLNQWLRLGAEWTLRKTFVDDLDYVGESDGKVDPSDPYGFNYTTATHNNDWYSFCGITVTISMWPRRLECNDGMKSFNR